MSPLSLQCLQDQPVTKRRVLVRVDFNVPLQAGRVLDDGRIRAALPTIEYLLEHDASVALASHLGRPKGVDDRLRLTPVAKALSQLLDYPVRTASDCIGIEVEQALDALEGGQVLLLENLRFHPQEKKNEPDFSKQLAAPFDLFVQDAFGVLHRAHASTQGITRHVPACAGFLVQKEVAALEKLTQDPQHPFVAVIGGKKAEEKIGGLFGLLAHVDQFLIGGGVAYTFLVNRNLSVGNSIVAKDRIQEAKRFIESAYQKGATVVLPKDAQLTQTLNDTPEAVVCPINKIPEGWMGVDIGPETTKDFKRRLKAAKTVFWAGPLGAFEFPPFNKGTIEIAKTLAASKAFVVVGGGESGAAFAQAGVRAENVFVSTGGGASLAFVGGKSLPGLEALKG